MTKRDITILVKPVSGMCNMRCAYCFYADEMKKREKALCGIMNKDICDALISKALEYVGGGHISFVFQGGEPLLAGIEFFKYFIQQVKCKNIENAVVDYSVQTNGTLIDETWAAFFKENAFLLGLSMDGYNEIHDRYRRDNKGQPTHASVERAAEILERYEVPYNIVTVVTKDIAKKITSVYSYYRKKGYTYQQYIPCLDALLEEPGKEEWSLTSDVYGTFLIKLFDLWYKDRREGKFIYIPYFENLAGMLLGEFTGSCGMTGTCMYQNVVESDGRIYPCDFYVLDEYCIGSVADSSFEEADVKRRAFILESEGGLEECRLCPYEYICHGGCRRHRQGVSQLEKNFFCQSYKKFFFYAVPKLENLLRENRNVR